MLAILDSISRAGLVLGIVVILQPWWDQGLRVGFFLTALATILHIVTSHLVVPDQEGAP